MGKNDGLNLQTNLSLQTEEFQKGVEAAKAQMTKLKKSVKETNTNVLDSFSSLAKPLAAAFTVGSVIAFGKSATDAAETSEKANRRLLYSLHGNILAYGELSRQANDLRLKDGISATSIKQIQQLGANAGYSVDRIKKLTTASVELSSVTGIDLQAAYMQLNQTLSGNVGRLKRIDPAFASLTKTQLMNGAAIDLVNKKYAGFAENSATMSEKLESDLSKLKTTIGKNFLGGKEGLAGFADGIIRAITPTENLSGEMEQQRIKVNSLAMALSDHNLPLEVRRGLLAKMKALSPEVVKGLDAENISITRLTSNLYEYNKQQLAKITLTNKESTLNSYRQRQADVGGKIEQKESELGGVAVTFRGQIDLLTDTEKSKATLLKKAFDSDRDLAKYTQGLNDIIFNYYKGKSGYNTGGGRQMAIAQINELKDLQHQYKNLETITTGYEKSNQKFITDNNLIDKPAKEKRVQSAEEIKENEKVESTKQKLVELTSGLIAKWNKEISTNTVDEKAAEIEIWRQTEREKINAVKQTGEEQTALKNAALADIDEIAKRKRAEINKNILPKNAHGVDNLQNLNKDPSFWDTEKGGAEAAANKNLMKLMKLYDQVNAKMKTVNTTSKNLWHGISMGSTTVEENLSSIGDSLGNLANNFNEQSAAYKAFATSQAIISTYTAATNIMVPTSKLGPVAMALAVGSTIAMGVANVAKINGVKFANGGIVQGNSFAGDRIHAYVNSGEMILNSGQQANLFRMLNSAGGGNADGREIILRAKGADLVGVLDVHNRRRSKIQ
jgi:hypothetical protein